MERCRAADEFCGMVVLLLPQAGEERTTARLVRLLDYRGLAISTTELAMNGLVMILVAIALMLLPVFARTPRSDLRDDRNG